MTRAAARLGIVQPALSTQIAKLERDLQVQLFNRSRRGVTPTAAGTDLYKMLLPLTTEVASVRQRMRDLSGHASGAVRLGVVPSLGVSIMPRLLADYCNGHPEVALRLSEAYSSELVERLEAGALDVVIVNRSQKLQGLDVRPLVVEELVLVLATDSPLAGAGEMTLDGVPPEKLIVPTPGQGLRVVIDSALARRKLVARPSLEIDALNPTLELVKTGNWATILPISAISHELEQGTLRICRVDQDMRRELVAVHHPRRPVSLAAQQLVDRLAVDIERAVGQAQQALAQVGPVPVKRRSGKQGEVAAGD